MGAGQDMAIKGLRLKHAPQACGYNAIFIDSSLLIKMGRCEALARYRSIIDTTPGQLPIRLLSSKALNPNRVQHGGAHAGRIH
jgi:hypothetical protein